MRGEDGVGGEAANFSRYLVKKRGSKKQKEFENRREDEGGSYWDEMKYAEHDCGNCIGNRNGTVS